MKVVNQTCGRGRTAEVRNWLLMWQNLGAKAILCAAWWFMMVRLTSTWESVAILAFLLSNQNFYSALLWMQDVYIPSVRLFGFPELNMSHVLSFVPAVSRGGKKRAPTLWNWRKKKMLTGHKGEKKHMKDMNWERNDSWGQVVSEESRGFGAAVT